MTISSALQEPRYRFGLDDQQLKLTFAKQGYGTHQPSLEFIGRGKLAGRLRKAQEIIGRLTEHRANPGQSGEIWLARAGHIVPITPLGEARTARHFGVGQSHILGGLAEPTT